jgi:hypothetical protein
MELNREHLIDLLKKKFPSIYLRTTEEFFGANDEGLNGIWCCSAEDAELKWKRKRLFHYYNEFPTQYENGVYKGFAFLLDINGWYAQWHDAGTLMFYESK